VLRTALQAGERGYVRRLRSPLRDPLCRGTFSR
jgi:hypothetical protein